MTGGIKKLGNTSYMASIVQIFAHTPMISSYIIDQLYLKDVFETSVVLDHLNKCLDYLHCGLILNPEILIEILRFNEDINWY